MDKLYPARWIQNIFNSVARLKDNIWHAIKTTPIEIVIGIVLGIGLGLYKGYLVNLEESQTIPIAYSDIEIQKKGWDDGETYPLTEFYAHTSDACVHVMEAHNESFNASSTPNKAFGEYLAEDGTTTYNIKPFYNRMVDAIEGAETAAAQSLEKLENLDQAAHSLQEAKLAVENTWEYNRQDKHRTEIYPSLECHTNANGNQSCHTVLKTRVVYDHSVHTYTYNQEFGELADELLQSYFAEHPDLSVEEQITLTNEVSLFNRRIIDQYTKQDSLSQSDYLDLANISRTQSNYNQNYNAVQSNQMSLKDQTYVWNGAKDTISQTQYVYKTRSRSDDGPSAFQVIELALEHTDSLLQNATEITDGIRLAQQKFPELEQQINDYIKMVKNDASEEDLAVHREKIMDLTDQIYKANIKDGIEINQTNVFAYVLYGLAGAAGGALFGYATDIYIARHLKRQDEIMNWHL